MKDIGNFLIENTVDFGTIMKTIPVPILKSWVKGYKESGTTEDFEKWVDENAWMIVDSSYTKVKNYSVFLQDREDTLSLFGSRNKIGEEVNSKFILEYFKPLFNSIFFDEHGNYNEKNLNDWVKNYCGYKKKEFIGNLVEKRDSLDEPEFSEILLCLFIQSLGVTVENYFDLSGLEPPTLEDAEYTILGFVDCSDPNLGLREKWQYLESHGKYLNAEIYKKTLYQMLRSKDLDQRRIVSMLFGMKSKKLRLNVIRDQLSKKDQHLFCSCWQKVTGV